MGGWGAYAGYEAEPEVTERKETLETLSNVKLRRLKPTIREYSIRLGLPDLGDRFTSKQHIIRITSAVPRIKAYVRPLDGKLTPDQAYKFFRYMVENPIGDFAVSDDLVADRPQKVRVKIERRKLREAKKKEAKKRADFYGTWEWRRTRYEVLQKYGSRCMVCGAGRSDTDMDGNPVRICVDHIKPLSKYWHLRLDHDNLQVLCAECNQGKGAWDETDHRPEIETSSKCQSSVSLE